MMQAPVWSALMSHSLAFLGRRLVLVLAAAIAAALIPLPVWAPRWIVYVHVPAVAFLTVCAMGKLLIDTLFYPRHP